MDMLMFQLDKNIDTPLYEQLYEAIKTPILSTGEYDWYNKTFGTDKLTASQLKSKLEEGVRSNKLNEDDVNRIIKIYGVNSR